MIALLGFGNVGRAFAELLYRKSSIRICAVFDRSGGVVNPAGFSQSEMSVLLQLPRSGVASSGIGRAGTIDDALDCASVLVDVLPPNYVDAKPSIDIWRKALAKGLRIVTANKAPLALFFPSLPTDRIYYTATVMAGTPVVKLVRALAIQGIRLIRGILNGSTNYVLTRVYKDGVGFADAVEEAKKLGLLEPDPSLDLGGLDAAAKAVILANTVGLRLTLGEVERVPITSEVVSGGFVKQVVSINFDEGRVSVRPEQVGESDPLRYVEYNFNGVSIVTDVNDVFVKGKGAGRLETAFVLLSDVLEAAQ